MRRVVAVFLLALVSCQGNREDAVVEEEQAVSDAARALGVAQYVTVAAQPEHLEMLALDATGVELAKITVDVAKGKKLRIEGFANADGPQWSQHDGDTLEPIWLPATHITEFNLLFEDPQVVAALADYGITIRTDVANIEGLSEEGGEAAYYTNNCSGNIQPSCLGSGHSGCTQAQGSGCEEWQVFDWQWACCNSPQELVQRVCNTYGYGAWCSAGQLGCSVNFGMGGSGCCVTWTGSWSQGPCPFE